MKAYWYFKTDKKATTIKLRRIYHWYLMIKFFITRRRMYFNYLCEYKFWEPIHPSKYNLAIRDDGKMFRVDKRILDYCDELPENKFVLLKSDGKVFQYFKYFTIQGDLREKYWGLPRILKTIK